MSKPSLILVHGSWHSPDHFGPLMKVLQEQGFICVAVALPSTQSLELPPATLTDDVTAVRIAVNEQLDQGHNVVVVAHSYGGHVANRALQGLDSKTRSSNGASTAVLAIAFIAGLPLPPGPSFLGGMGGRPAPVHDLSIENFVLVGEPGPEYYFYNDLPEIEAKAWSDLLKPQSWLAYLEESPDAAYLDIPSGYLFCKNDQVLPYEMQKGIIDAAIEGGAKFVHTEAVYSSHSPFLSMPEQTTEFIIKVAGENVE